MKTKELVLQTAGPQITLNVKEIVSDNPCYTNHNPSKHSRDMSDIKKKTQKSLLFLRTSDGLPLFRQAELAYMSQQSLEDCVASCDPYSPGIQEKKFRLFVPSFK